MLWENTIENLEACIYGVEEHNAKAETLAKLKILTAAKAENSEGLRLPTLLENMVNENER